MSTLIEGVFVFVCCFYLGFVNVFVVFIFIVVVVVTFGVIVMVIDPRNLPLTLCHPGFWILVITQGGSPQDP